MSFSRYIIQHAFWKVVLTSVFSIGSGFGAAVLIGLIQQQIHHPASRLGTWALLYFGFLLLQLLLMILATYFSALLAQDIIHDLRHILVRHFLQNPFQKIENSRDAFFSVLTTDIQNLADGMRQVPGFLGAVGMLLGCIGYLLFVTWELALSILPVLMLSFLFVVIPKRFLQRYSQRVQVASKQLFYHVQTVVEGTKELILNHARRAQFLSTEYVPVLDSFRKASLHEQTFRGVLTKTSEYFLFVFLGIGILIVSMTGIVKSEQFLMFLTTVLFIIGPLSSITALAVSLPKIELSIKHIEQFKNDIHEPAPYVDHVPLASCEALILRDVEFSYFNREEDRHFKLGPINATFRPGEVTFIVGGNGSGKSTLGKLLCGLYLPSQGTISVGSLSLNDATQKQFHLYFSAIFSDFYVFDSILGGDAPNEKLRVAAYINHLQLSHKVSLQESKFSTTQLSQGQRKRLALVHALQEDRPFYILDEWAADQDPEFKRFFYEVLLPELKEQGKCVIAITHDDQYFSKADHVIFLNDGQLTLKST